MSIKPFVSFVFACAAAVALVLVTADSSHAISKCKVKVDKKTGLIQVDATGVAGPLQWGGQPGGVDNSFFNDATCVASDRAKRCTLADPADIGSKTPPAGCTIHLDDGVTPCAAWVKGCTPARVLCVSQVGDDVFFEGCNVHVRSGAGSTSAAVNGLGNLIVGYDEDGGWGADGGWFSGDNKGGSHYLVVGQYHTYSSFGGLVVGYDNNVSGAYSSVSGGSENTASDTWSSVSGGVNNTASGDFSSVSGGVGNTASGYYSSVSGGASSDADGDYSSVSGGKNNTASGWYSSVGGGEENTASGTLSSVSSGQFNTASGHYSSVSGGYQNIAGRICTSGLVGEACTLNNECDTSVGAGDGVCAGSTVGYYSSVSGGKDNTASGNASSVSGGLNRTAPGSHDWVAGALFEDQ